MGKLKIKNGAEFYNSAPFFVVNTEIEPYPYWAQAGFCAAPAGARRKTQILKVLKLIAN